MPTNLSKLKTPKSHAPRGRVLVHGHAGTGKSSLLASLASLGPMLYIYFPGEEGISSLTGHEHEDNIRLHKVTDPDDLSDDLYPQFLKGSHDFASIGIDSVTALQSLKAKSLLNQPLDGPAEFRPQRDYDFWNDMASWFNDFFTFFYGLADAGRNRPVHVAMTAQTAFKESEDESESKMYPDLFKGPRAPALRVPDHILYTFLEEDEDVDLGDDEGTTHAVRIKASPLVSAKIHAGRKVADKLPPVLGRDSPLQLPTLLKALGASGV